jgi:hypothetical protein
VPTPPATQREVEAALTRYLSQGPEPLTLFFAAHGEKGEVPRQNFVALWGDGTLSVERLAELHADHPRPLRVVSGSCFSGGFADLAFDGAEVSRGPTTASRCGLFSTTWNREASGCDPNPDRRQQQGYVLHVLHALGGEDREGRALPLGRLDLDGDGKIGLLEAHTHARVRSRSIDVPTTTSERFLRAVQREGGAQVRDLLPEEVFVVEELGKALDLRDAGRVKERWQLLDAELDELDEQLARAEVDVDRAFSELRAALLSRWPVLDDPFHPEFATTIEHHAESIRKVVDTSPEARAFEEAQARLTRLDDRFFERLAAEALVLRLARAHETLSLAGALAIRGGEDFEAYQRLLRCERAAP